MKKVILNADPGEEPWYEVPEGGRSRRPHYVRVKGRGIVAVYIHNLIMAIRDANKAISIVNRVWKNVRHFRLRFKEWCGIRFADDVDIPEEVPPICLGRDYRMA